MHPLVVPFNLTVLAAFVIFYGWVIHRAAKRGVYGPTGIRALDCYIVPWLLGLTVAIPPATLYGAFGFDEFGETPDGIKLRDQLRTAARIELLLLAIFGLAVIALVPQK